MIKEGPECTCIACPTIFEFTDFVDVPYYFRLRHGYARVSKDDSLRDEIVSGVFGEGDGVCSWNEVVEWAKEKGLLLIKPEEEKDRMINYLFNKTEEWEWCSQLRRQSYEDVLEAYNRYKKENEDV